MYSNSLKLKLKLKLILIDYGNYSETDECTLTFWSGHWTTLTCLLIILRELVIVQVSDGRKMSDMTTGKFFQVDFAITGDGHFLQLCRFITHRMVKTSCHQVVLFGCQKPLVDRTIHKHTKNGVSFKLNRLDSMSMSMQYFRIHVI